MTGHTRLAPSYRKSVGERGAQWQVGGGSPLLHSIRDADALHLNSLCESLVGGDQGGSLNFAFSLPPGVCLEAGDQVVTTGAFEVPVVARLWFAVSSIVAETGRSNFTDLQIHLNNDGREHTDRGDYPQPVRLEFGGFSGGAFRLHPRDRSSVELRATQHTLEFDGNTPHSVDDTEAAPSCRSGPRRRPIVCHTK